MGVGTSRRLSEILLKISEETVEVSIAATS
jgi:phosphoribosyl-ATP pyrophosphohydrolase